MMQQMQTLGRFCLSLAVDHSLLGLHHNFLRFSLRFMDFPSTFNFLTQASELGCGFVLLGYFSRLFNLIGLALIFLFCIRILRFYDTPRFRSKPKIQTLDAPLKSHVKNDDEVVYSEEKDRDENLEDEVFDVMSLRKLVKMERQRFQAACAEIDKERTAASSAAEEAMAMILRLQNEKGTVEIQANQFRRMVEERQEYDLEVIETLRWEVAQLESQNSLLEEQLGVYKEKLREFMKDDEIQQLQVEEEAEEPVEAEEFDEGKEKLREFIKDDEIQQLQVEEEAEEPVEAEKSVEAEESDETEESDVAKDFCNFSVELDLVAS